jgi:hypothetical protein
MFDRLKVKLPFVSLLLLVGMLPITVGASQQPAPQEKGFVLSERAIAAAERFRDEKHGRNLEDLDLSLASSMNAIRRRVCSREWLSEPQLDRDCWSYSGRLITRTRRGRLGIVIPMGQQLCSLRKGILRIGLH